jgi:dienelactone hydrolase
MGARPTDYSSIAEELASRGYVVAAPANTYAGPTVVFPDGRVAKTDPSLPDPDRLVRVWADDISTVIAMLSALNHDSKSALYRELDMRHVGVIGHSFGGAASAQFCSTDDRCGAGIDMDGTLYGDPLKKGIRQPFLFMLSEGSLGFPGRLKTRTRTAWETAYRQDLAQDRAVCALSPNCHVEIEPGFRHVNFTDSAALFRAPLSWAHPSLGAIGGYEGLHLIRIRIDEFLDRWIRG